MEIVQERLEREGGVEVVQTAPTVTYQIKTTTGDLIEIHNPADLPDPSQIDQIREPIVKIEIICPDANIGDLMSLCDGRRGLFQSQKYISEGRQMLIFEIPLAEIIYDFYDKLKSITRGYGTMDYEIIEYRAERLAKVSILVNGMPVEALSMICHRDNAEKRTRGMLLKLRKQIDRHQFEIALQAAIGGKIIARETVKSLRKNVTAKCYGGDVSRKRKLLEKQKRGKKRMKSVGSVLIPQEAFLSILDTSE
jgi:GTP-binding protein LepA